MKLVEDIRLMKMPELWTESLHSLHEGSQRFPTGPSKSVKWTSCTLELPQMRDPGVTLKSSARMQ